MKWMFANCKTLKSIDLSSFKIKEEIIPLKDSFSNILKIVFNNCTNMSFMFYGCENLTSIDLYSSLNSKNPKSIDMSNFDKQLQDINISSSNTEKKKNMYCMFCDCIKLKKIKFSSSFNTKDVTNMKGIFNN